jgi:hypothetical protein
MNTFKRKALFTAVIAGLGVSAGTAEAVYLNPNKTGQALIYPYYTVQSTAGNSWNTYLSIVNTTTRAKAVKVRFIEGKTSAEVLDFNLFLSPNDMWTAAIVPADATAGSPAHLLTADVSCTNPAIPAGGVDFRNFQYQTGDDALPGTGLDRTREGYVEMIEMGTLTGAWAAAVTHNSAGVPANCAVVQVTTSPSSIESPTGGLVGTGTLINVNSGRDVGYKADALEAWRTASDYTIPSATTPNLGDATPTVSVVVNAGGVDAATGSSALITAYRTTFAGSSGASAGAQAVASVFMHSAVINEYILDTATASATDWVVTQPLKRAFVTSTVAAAPYSNLLTTNGACETIGFTYFNREEKTQTASGTDFSPLPPAAPANSMCWESNVLAIRNTTAATGATSAVLGSMNVTNVTVNSTFQNGWGRLSFLGTSAVAPAGMGGTADIVNLGMNVLAATVTPAVPVTFFGLPVTGFMVRTFDNGGLTCGTATCQGNYSALFPHSYVTSIAP